jgi:alanine dehydrogenase
MNMINIGILREGKTPPDKRVPLTPKQCRMLQEKYSNAKVYVQSSEVRAFTDKEYSEEGIEVLSDISHCDYFFGVKEVNVADLVPSKKFVFFSHTIKKQPYNQKLLRAILDQRIQLIDYEVMRDSGGKRILGFGRYAGIVGAYNGFRALGLKTGSFELRPAHLCKDRKEMEDELKHVILPNDFKVVVSGFGRVGHGAREILSLLPIKEVAAEQFSNAHNEPVFTQLEVHDYYAHKDGTPFDKPHFYSNPQEYTSTFGRFVTQSDMYIACHFWSNRSPLILTKDDLNIPNRRLQVVADISCDIDGPIACTIRPSTIQDPIYGYDPSTGEETDYKLTDSVAVMAVDNLPCELPRDASEDFGNELLRLIFPAIFESDPDRIIERASETSLEGKLMPEFEYLTEYVQ